MFTDSELTVNADVHWQSDDNPLGRSQNATMSEHSLAENLTRLRKAAGMTLEQLAEAADLSKSYVQMMEKGKRENPSKKAIAGVSAALGCQPADLFQGVDLGEQDEMLNDIIEVTKMLTPESRRLALKLLKQMIEAA